MSQSKPVFNTKTDFVIEHAFTYAGEDYFRCADAFKLPAGRAFAVRRYYHQLKSSCSLEWLKAFHAAMQNILSNPQKIDITKIAELNKYLGERLQYAYTDDDVLRFASVMYFTQEESPYTYDQAYNNRKIQKWREAGDVYAFFLSEPIETLVPYLKQLGGSTRIYSEAVNQMQGVQISALLSMLSTEQSSADYAQSLRSLHQVLPNTTPLNERESSNTSESSMPNLRALNRKNLSKHKKGNDDK